MVSRWKLEQEQFPLICTKLFYVVSYLCDLMYVLTAECRPGVQKFLLAFAHDLIEYLLAFGGHSLLQLTKFLYSFLSLLSKIFRPYLTIMKMLS